MHAAQPGNTWRVSYGFTVRVPNDGYATARECIKGPVWVASGVRPGTYNTQNDELAGLTRLIKYANRRLKLVRTSLQIYENARCAQKDSREHAWESASNEKTLWCP